MRTAALALITWMAPLSSLGCTLDRTGTAADAKVDPQVDAGATDAGRDAGADAFVPDGSFDAGRADAGFDACAPMSEVCNATDDDCDAIVDEGETCAPCARVERGTSVYLLCITGMAWPDARRYCLDRSYDLVVIESMEEDAFVWAESGRLHGFDSWLGLEDMETNGEYYWVDGTPCWREDMLVGPFHSFRGGMPEDLESQACVEQDIDSGGQWADAECEQVQPFVCEATLR